MHRCNFSKTLVENVINCRYYYTNRLKKTTLYSTISPLGNPSISVVPELDDWLHKGKTVGVAEIQRIIHDLRKRKRFSQALEVSEWTKEKGICVFSPSEHAVQLDLIGRVRGFVLAENYFGKLHDQNKTNKTYGALLNCYVRQRETEKSLSHFQKMKEMGLASSPLTYNDIMCLYTNIGQHEKVPEVLSEMKRNGISPDNFSYRICINSYGVKSDLEGVEKVLREMEGQSRITMDWNSYAVAANFYIAADQTEKAIDVLKKSEERLDKKDGIGYNYLITQYARLGSKREVLRLWDLEKTACKRYINRDCITMLQSLVALGELVEAEKVLKDWESSGNYYDFRVPNTVLLGYLNKAMPEKAESVLLDCKAKGKPTTQNSWGKVATGYANEGKMEKAMACMKMALSLAIEKEWKPNQGVISSIVIWLGDEGSVEDVEAFIGSVKTAIPVNREMYHALIKAYMRSGKEVKKLLDDMKNDKIDQDEETKTILAKA